MYLRLFGTVVGWPCTAPHRGPCRQKNTGKDGRSTPCGRHTLGLLGEGWRKPGWAGGPSGVPVTGQAD